MEADAFLRAGPSSPELSPIMGPQQPPRSVMAPYVDASSSSSTPASHPMHAVVSHTQAAPSFAYSAPAAAGAPVSPQRTFAATCKDLGLTDDEFEVLASILTSAERERDRTVALLSSHLLSNNADSSRPSKPS